MKRLTGQAMRGLVSNSNGSEISKARKLA
jgi:hypothetical protein